jgi:hypothetical protein
MIDILEVHMKRPTRGKPFEVISRKIIATVENDEGITEKDLLVAGADYLLDCMRRDNYPSAEFWKSGAGGVASR